MQYKKWIIYGKRFAFLTKKDIMAMFNRKKDPMIGGIEKAQATRSYTLLMASKMQSRLKSKGRDRWVTLTLLKRAFKTTNKIDYFHEFFSGGSLYFFPHLLTEKDIMVSEEIKKYLRCSGGKKCSARTRSILFISFHKSNHMNANINTLLHDGEWIENRPKVRIIRSSIYSRTISAEERYKSAIHTLMNMSDSSISRLGKLTLLLTN